jgi:hypothetical protein
MKLQSDFALLDVKRGRKALAKLMPNGSNKTDYVIPVVIKGYISHRHGNDDGISIEFGVEVTSVEIVERSELT